MKKQKLYNSHLGLSGLSAYKFEDSLKAKEKVLDGKVETDAIRDADGFFTDQFVSEAAAVDAEKVSDFLHAFSSGKLPAGNEKIKDVLMTSDYPDLFYSATEIVLRSRIYPAAVVSQNLFRSVPYSGNAQTVTIRSIGGIKFEEIAEGASYPEQSTSVADQSYRIHFEIKKYGAKIAATRELIDSDNWGIFAATIAQLGDEIAMLREKICISKLNNEAGYVLIDNAAPNLSALGTTTGRGIDGKQNGALGLDDLMEMMAYMQQRGYNIDTVLLHPFAYMAWCRDPEMREIVFGQNFPQNLNGGPAAGWPDAFGPWAQTMGRFGGAGTASGLNAGAVAQAGNTIDPIFGKLGISQYAYPNLTPFGATFYTNPKYTAWPLKIIVSPLVPFYKISGLSTNTGLNGKYACNIILADSRKAGILLEREEPTMEKWSDIEKEIEYMKVRTRFGVAFQEQGRAIAIAKNVVIDRTYGFDNVNSVTLTPISNRLSNNLLS